MGGFCEFLSILVICNPWNSVFFNQPYASDLLFYKSKRPTNNDDFLMIFFKNNLTFPFTFLLPLCISIPSDNLLLPPPDLTQDLTLQALYYHPVHLFSSSLFLYKNVKNKLPSIQKSRRISRGMQ